MRSRLVYAIAAISLILVNALWFWNGRNDSQITSDLADAAIQLQSEKSMDGLKSLLRLNGQPDSGLLRLGTTNTFPKEFDTEGWMVVDAAQVKSGGQTFQVAMSAVQPDSIHGLSAPPQAPMTFIFTENGRFLKSFGSRNRLSDEFAETIKVTTLGTKDFWFVWTDRDDFSTTPPSQHSNVYLIQNPVVKVLEVRSHRSGIAYSGKLSSPGDCYLRFTATKSHSLTPTDRGKAANGSAQLPVLNWDSEAISFKGPSRMTYGGEFLFEINQKTSAGFQATDHR